MKIASSEVYLQSQRKYREISKSGYTRGSFLTSLKGTGSAGIQDNAANQKHEGSAITESSKDGRDSYQAKEEAGSDYLDESNVTYGYMRNSPWTVKKSDTIADPATAMSEFQQQIIRLIQEFMERIARKSGNPAFQALAEGMSNQLTFTRVERSESYHYEEESTTFAGEGRAVTADGRVISFGVGIAMSRTFEQYVKTENISASLTDPLVINVDSSVTEIADQQFYFDLDCDGKQELIHNVAAGSGFLALDKNGDGSINDGSELFGTKSGKGFSDLMQYDEDGNGWIDENDSVYGKLRVWTRDENGRDTLITLKKADVGAIYLGSASTDFAHKDINGNTRAMLRSTGVFLKESGGVGTVQQVDLANMADLLTRDRAIKAQA